MQGVILLLGVVAGVVGLDGLAVFFGLILLAISIDNHGNKVSNETTDRS